LGAELLLTRLREVIDLPSSGGKRILDRYLNMFVPRILRRRVVDENVFVRRNCKPDMDLEAGTVTMLVTRCDHKRHPGRDDWEVYGYSCETCLLLTQCGHLAPTQRAVPELTPGLFPCAQYEALSEALG